LDIFEESQANFGEIDKFQIFEENPEGVIKIKFKSPTSAEKCIQALNGRFYNGKQIEAVYWDGKTDYSKISENSEIQNKRIEEFGKWLEN
jgi:HIV Tat-specific factor 1